jgi:glycosyltransferase involved in cell wall biosynthesis
MTETSSSFVSNGPLVSVCIPSYNSKSYLGETILCLLNQTYQNLEIIVVDDGSTDGTADFLESLADNRIRYLVQANKGAAAARNVAYRLSSGDFVKFLDADDLLSAASIESQLRRIVNEPGSVASGKWGRFFAADASDFTLAPEKIWKDVEAVEWLVSSLVESGSNMVQPGIFLIPRNIIELAGPWNEELSLVDDFEYMTRVLCRANRILFCEEAVLFYRSGLLTNLSAKKSAAHMKSAYDAVHLATRVILDRRNDPRSRLACANAYQRWAYQFYPYYRTLCNNAEQEIMKLGGSSINLGGGKMYLFLNSLTGWKMAKRLKMFLKGKHEE